MHKLTITLSIIVALLCGCGKKPEPVAPPSAEAIAAFTEAAYAGNAQQVSAALKNGMPVDQVEENGNSALMLASFNGHVETINVLLDAGANVNMRDCNGRTPLMFASSGPFPSAAKLLLARGAEVNAFDTAEHFTALMYAAGEGLSPVVDILLNAGADPKMKDVDNDTAASFARQRGHTALANRLQKLIDSP